METPYRVPPSYFKGKTEQTNKYRTLQLLGEKAAIKDGHCPQEPYSPGPHLLLGCLVEG